MLEVLTFLELLVDPSVRKEMFVVECLAIWDLVLGSVKQDIPLRVELLLQKLLGS